jgi:hypothetical protein
MEDIGVSAMLVPAAIPEKEKRSNKDTNRETTEGKCSFRNRSLVVTFAPP